MRFYTHIAFGFLCAFLIQKGSLDGALAIFYAGVFLGIIVPDIDNASSFIGRKVRPLSWILQFTVGHRGIFHSLLFGLITAYLLISLDRSGALGFLIGYFSHLLLDSATPAGIMWLFPVSVRKVRGPVKTGSFTEWMLFPAFGLLDVLFLLQL